MGKYFDPYTDFGFKKLFREEANKNLLIDFLNTLLPEKHHIQTLTFDDPEHLGPAASDRRAVFDIFCKGQNDEHFIVEMQKTEQKYFVDRSIYNTAHHIRQQGQRGKSWDYRLAPVYFIGILDFVFEKDVTPTLIHNVSLKDQGGTEFYDKLRYIYLQMPVFDKKESELVTHQDKWFYFLENLEDLNQIPSILGEEVFQQAFHTAELASMSEKDRYRYEKELDDYRVQASILQKAGDDGEAKGAAKGEVRKAIEIARNMKMKGLEPALIAEMTGLPLKEIKQLK